MVSIGSCKDSASATVTVNSTPVAAAWSNTTITIGASATLSASGGGNYSWSNGGNSSAISVSPLITTDYCVFVSNSGSGSCVDSACVTVLVEPVDCLPFESENAFVLPNAFSPNGDNQNEKFHLINAQFLASCVKEIYIAIYNRWGEKIFESSDINFSWDGIYRNKPEDTAVFAYYLKAVLNNGKEVKKKGNISLLR
jgi:gliding motility-associated-like protein